MAVECTFMRLYESGICPLDHQRNPLALTGIKAFHESTSICGTEEDVHDGALFQLQGLRRALSLTDRMELRPTGEPWSTCCSSNLSSCFFSCSSCQAADYAIDHGSRGGKSTPGQVHGDLPSRLMNQTIVDGHGRNEQQWEEQLPGGWRKGYRSESITYFDTPRAAPLHTQTAGSGGTLALFAVAAVVGAYAAVAAALHRIYAHTR